MDIQQEHKLIVTLQKGSFTRNIRLGQEVTVEPAFTMSEADGLSIQLCHDLYYVEIDDYASNQTRLIRGRKSYQIVKGASKWSKMYLPGSYQLYLRNDLNETIITHTFLVLPVGVSYSFRETMIQEIAQYLQSVHCHTSFKRFQRIGLYAEQQDLTYQHSLNRLTKELKTAVVTTYEPSRICKRQDARSMRYEATNLNATVGYFNVRKQQTLDIPINQALKYVVHQLLRKNDTHQHALQQLAQALVSVTMKVSDVSILQTRAYYKDVYELYHHPKDVLQVMEEKLVPVSRKTSELFELYVLIRLLEDMVAKGYEIITEPDALEKQLLERNYGKIKLQKEEQVVVIDYDVELANRTRGMMSINSYHQRPDFLLKFYQGEDLDHVVIIEVKCRNKKNIFERGKQLTSELETTLRDYLNLGYVDADANLHMGKVSQVHLVYPNSHQETYTQFYGRIVLHGVSEPYNIR